MAPANLENLEDERDEIFAVFEKEFEVLLRSQTSDAAGRGRGPGLDRSGSAPPNVEAARAALYGHAGAGEARWSPAPRPPTRDEGLPRSARASVGERRLGEDLNSLFSVQPGLPASEGGRDSRPSRPTSADLVKRGPAGFPRGGLGPRSKSFAEVLLQEDFTGSTSISGHLSRPVSRNAFGKVVDPMGLSDVEMMHHRNHSRTVDEMHSGASSNRLVRVQSLGSAMPHSFTSNLDSLVARSTTSEAQLIARPVSPRLSPLIGRMSDMDMKIGSNDFGGVSSCVTDFGDTTIALSGLMLGDKTIDDGHNHVHGQFQQEFTDHRKLSFIPGDESQYIQQDITNQTEIRPGVPSNPLQVYNDFPRKNGFVKDAGLSVLTPNGLVNSSKHFSVNKKLSSGSTSLARPSGGYHTNVTNIDFNVYNSPVYSATQGPPAMLSNQIDAGAFEGPHFNRTANQVGPGFQVPYMDQLHAQYLQRTSDMARFSSASRRDPSLERTNLDATRNDIPYQEEYLEALLAQQKLHYAASLSGNSRGFGNYLHGNPAFGLGVPYPGQLSGSVLSSLSPESPLRQNERLPHFSSTLRSATGGSKRSWNHENGMIEGGIISSSLDELKSTKTRSLEFSQIVGNVFEFSADQFGSRFIQQKLETASVEEKNKIFPEILPRAYDLMTDVFGNYVIQKFFEHGTESQRSQLADQLMGHVLPLSLQMYGCRVIQKALEVVDVDHQTQMVAELDGSVMKCVRDQNGNHVIQKCIECIPQERILFIISSFYGQVVSLSTHPYGCRVIQRVLEHCSDAKTQSIMIDEIMQFVSPLAQDQYGNYVVQHVLQHGRKEERSAIIRKLTGQVVKMSQQKFASNVVEKCLTHGTPDERQLLINEILGSTDENEPLQAMMKDQYGNYVVQKLLEICDDRNRELILARIKVHLNALKKYTYGKHIVARVEKLITTGEKRSAMSA